MGTWEEGKEESLRNDSISSRMSSMAILINRWLLFPSDYKNSFGHEKKDEDMLMKEVLNGGYNVHPVPPPNSEIKERIRKRYERKRIKIEKLLTLGYTTSGDP